MPTSQLDIAAIREAAWRIAEERIAEGWTVPKRDAILRHGIGLYGEHAVAHYLTQRGLTLRSIAEDWAAIKDRLGDIELVSPDGEGVIRLEVKTTTPQMWIRRGPLPMKPMRADAVVWCTIPFNAVSVRLLGWSLLPLDDVRDPKQRDVADLPDWVRSRWADLRYDASG